MPSYFTKKTYWLVTLLIGLFHYSSTYAALKLQSAYPKDVSAELRNQASEYGISDAKAYEKQSFYLLHDGRNVGKLAAGLGRNASGERVCFITWTPTESEQDTLIPTIGFGDFETTTCDDTTSVGLISSGSEDQTRLAIIYEISSPNATAYQSIVLKLDDDKKLTLDAKLTSEIGADGAKNMSELRKLYARKYSN